MIPVKRRTNVIWKVFCWLLVFIGTVLLSLSSNTYTESVIIIFILLFIVLTELFEEEE